MVALLSAETVLLVLLLVLVAGLLRSHAEILRRLGPPEEGQASAPAGIAPPPVARGPDAIAAAAIAGATPDGDAVTIDFAGPARGPTLLAFLTSGCSACLTFWETLGEPRLPADVRTVIVTHGAERERPARLRALAPDGVPVVMCSQAWAEYRAPGAPYFVLVDGAIRGEGVASTWHALASLIADALEEQSESSQPSKARGIDAVFAAGGIGPEHPSLYPGRTGGSGSG